MTGIHDEERRFGKFKSHMTLKARTGRGSDVKETKAGQGYIRQEAVGVLTTHFLEEHSAQEASRSRNRRISKSH